MNTALRTGCAGASHAHGRVLPCIVAVLLFIAGCASSPSADDPAAALSALPLLPGSAMVVDGSWRLHIELREREAFVTRADSAWRAGADGDESAPADEQQDLLLVLRSDVDGFRFEAMNELGLPVLRWPVADQQADIDAGSNRGMDVSLIARFIQLALAEPAVWTAALSGARIQLVPARDGGRTLLIDAAPRIYLSAPGKLRRMLVCMQSSVVSGRCRSGSEVQIDVEALLAETAIKSGAAGRSEAADP